MRSLKVFDSMALCFLEVIFILTDRLFIVHFDFEIAFFFVTNIEVLRLLVVALVISQKNKTKLKYLSPWAGERVRE